MTVKKCTKKRDVVVLLIKPFAFVAFPLPSSDLKVPAIALVDGQNYSKTQRVDADFFFSVLKKKWIRVDGANLRSGDFFFLAA